jgi:hypothetical protein
MTDYKDKRDLRNYCELEEHDRFEDVLAAVGVAVLLSLIVFLCGQFGVKQQEKFLQADLAQIAAGSVMIEDAR